MQTTENQLSLMIVDDHPLFRAGLRTVISLRRDFTVVAEAEDLPSAVARHREHRPDVTLMDLRLSDDDGIEATRRICAECPGARVLMLTTYDGDDDIHRALEAGAVGYLLKSIPGPELLRAIDAAARGQRYIPPAVQQRLDERATFGVLTDREREVLPLVAKGLTNREIAGLLKFTEFTAKAHVRSLLAKLGAADRTELVSIAAQRGLIHFD